MVRNRPTVKISRQSAGMKMANTQFMHNATHMGSSVPALPKINIHRRTMEEQIKNYSLSPKNQPYALIVMADNRPLSNIFSNSTYWLKAAAINYAYSTRHNMLFRYYSLTQPCRCAGYDRHPAWCKILAIQDLLLDNEIAEDSLIFYMDSDMAFIKDIPTIQDYLADVTNTRFLSPDTAFMFSEDWPFDCFPMSGNFWLIKNDLSRHLLQLWWNYADDHDYEQKHGYEQHALRFGILTKHGGYYFKRHGAIYQSYQLLDHKDQIMRHHSAVVEDTEIREIHFSSILKEYFKDNVEQEFKIIMETIIMKYNRNINQVIVVSVCSIFVACLLFLNISFSHSLSPITTATFPLHFAYAYSYYLIAILSFLLSHILI